MKKVIFALFLGLCACQDSLDLEADQRSKDFYYQSEIIPESAQNFYGTWKLLSVSGGFSGQGFDPNFDYLEVKGFGLYSIIKDKIRIENGKIEVDRFDLKSNLLQIKFVPDSSNASPLLGTFPERYIDLQKGGKLNLNSPCCDAFDHHFERVK